MGVFKKGNNYYIDYYVRGRRRREKIGPNKRQASLVLQKRKVQIAEGKFLDLTREEKISFEDIAKEYIEVYSKPNKRSFWRDEISVKHLSSQFEKRLIQEITPLNVEKYKQKSGGKLKITKYLQLSFSRNRMHEYAI